MKKTTLKERDKTGMTGRHDILLIIGMLCGPAAGIAAAICGTGIIGTLGMWYAVSGMMTAIMYARDKYSAENNHWRIPEIILHLMSLNCGWIGALLTMHLIHHKNRKISFQIVFIICTLLNMAILWLLLHQMGIV